MRGSLLRWLGALLPAFMGVSCAAEAPKDTRLRIFVSSDEVLVRDTFVVAVEQQRSTPAGVCVRLRLTGPAAFADDITDSSQIAELRSPFRSWTLRAAEEPGEVVLSADILERGDAGCDVRRRVVGSAVPSRVVRVVRELTTRPSAIDAGAGDVRDASASPEDLGKPIDAQVDASNGAEDAR